jgi:hypothetical protein
VVANVRCRNGLSGCLLLLDADADTPGSDAGACVIAGGLVSLVMLLV